LELKLIMKSSWAVMNNLKLFLAISCNSKISFRLIIISSLTQMPFVPKTLIVNFNQLNDFNPIVIMMHISSKKWLKLVDRLDLKKIRRRWSIWNIMFKKIKKCFMNKGNWKLKIVNNDFKIWFIIKKIWCTSIN